MNLTCPAPAARITLRGAINSYMLDLQACGRSAGTLESYRGSLAELERLVGSETEIEAISAERLNLAIIAMRGQGLRPAGQALRSEVTMNRYRSSFRAFFRWAFETGTVAKNPAVRLRRAWVDSPQTMPITPVETSRLLATIRQSGDPLRLRDEALFAVYALTGMRRSEALALKISDYDAAGGTLCIREGKGRQWRMVPVAGPLRGILDEFCREDVRGHAGKLFHGRGDGRALTSRQAQARFEKWRKAAGLPCHLTIRSFRVGFATTLHAWSGDILSISRLLGHRDLRPILRYVSSSAMRNRALAGALEWLC